MSSATGQLIVIAGPSGAGKTTLAHHLVDTFSSAVFSISTTTRPPRGSEKDGVDYFFTGRDEFQKRIDDGYFLEYAEVHGHLYGTSKDWVLKELSRGASVILDIDVQGALQVKEAFPASILIFVLTSSPDVLRSRLISRNTDDPDVVRRRMETAARETGWIGSFDYYIRNDSLEDSLIQVEAIIQGEKLKLENTVFPREVRAFSPDSFRGLEYWEGRRVIVTSGPTREPLDRVRFISNRSSGLMGCSMAEAFRDAGADVLFVTGPACNSDPSGTDIVTVETAREMLDILIGEVEKADLLVMAAAVSDFSPSSFLDGKTERAGTVELELEATPDILEELHRSVKGMCPVMAFALEFGSGGEERAIGKMKRKGASAVFFNPGDIPGAGMEVSSNQGKLIFSNGSSEEVKRFSKRYIAELLAAAMGRYLMKGSEC
ncbi:MAG: guanylate kinase [Candidatus Aegiribacteria sp.]|nr:guanylate kinase [Candidatus Aegiribacteria sp.]